MSTMDYFLVFAYAFICIAGILGNLSVIISIGRHGVKRNVFYKYIFNLSLSHLIFLTCLPLLITTTIMKQWIFGNIMCKVYYAQTGVLMFTSTFLLVLMWIDVLLKAVFRMRYQQNRLKIYSGVGLVAAWFCSIIFATPLTIFAHEIKHDFKLASCTVQYPDSWSLDLGNNHFTILYNFIPGFAIPIWIIIVMIMLIKLNQYCSRYDSELPDDQGSFSVLLGHCDYMDKVNLTVLIKLTIAYIICWIGYWACQLYFAYGSESIPAWYIYLFHAFSVLSFANCIVNPCIFTFTRGDNGSRFIDVMLCKTAFPSGLYVVERTHDPTGPVVCFTNSVRLDPLQ